jgi:hypothetical protein
MARKTRAEEKSENVERLRQHMRHGGVFGALLLSGGRPIDGGGAVGLVTGGWSVTYPRAVVAEGGITLDGIRITALLRSPAPTDDDPNAAEEETVAADVLLPEPVTLSRGSPLHLVIPDRPGLNAGNPLAPAEEAAHLERDPADPFLQPEEGPPPLRNPDGEG